MTGHIILSTEDGIRLLDNMQSIFVDRELNELVMVGGGRICRIEDCNPEELLETIKAAFKRETTTFIEVNSHD